MESCDIEAGRASEVRAASGIASEGRQLLGPRDVVPHRRGRTPAGLVVLLVVGLAMIMVLSNVPGTFRAPAADSAPTQVAGGGPSLTIYPTSGPPGTSVTVNISGASSGAQFEVYFNNTAVPGFSISNDPFYYAGSTGKVSETYDPPSDGLTAGAYEFSAVELDVAQPVWVGPAVFEVTSSTSLLTATPSVGCGGTSVSLSGSGFSEGETYYVYIGPTAGSPGYELITDGITNSIGGVLSDLTIPALSSGSYTLFAEDGRYNYAATSFSCSAAPGLTLSPTQGPVGTVLAVSGTGFAPSSPITLSIGSQVVESSCSTDASGNFPGESGTPCTVVVPPAPTGAETLTATDPSDDLASATFTVVPQITLSAPYVPVGPVGTAITVTGTGWAPGDDVQFTFDTSTGCYGLGCSFPGITCLNSMTISTVGAFTCTGTIPSFLTTDTSYQIGAYVNGGASVLSATSFLVTGPPTVAISPRTAPGGAPVALTVTGLTPFETYAVYLDDSISQGVISADSVNVSQFTTLSDGSYSGTFTVPTGLTASYEYFVDVYEEVLGTYSYMGSAPLELVIALGLTIAAPYVPIGPAGTVVTLAGTGANPADSGSLQFYLTATDFITQLACYSSASSIVSPVIEPDGEFTCNTVIPSVAAGAYSFQVQDGDSGATGVSTSEFLVSSLPASAVSTNLNYGSMGTPVTLTVEGLTPDTQYAVFFDDAAGLLNPGASWYVMQFTTLSDGGYVGSFDVPSGLTIYDQYYVDVFQVVSGNDYYIASAALVFEVAPWTTTTVVSCAPDYGDPTTTCTATVTGEGGSVAGEPYSITGETIYWSTPYGQVAFWPMTCVLAGSPASCSVSATIVVPIPATTESITATYYGDASNIGSSASPIVEFYGSFHTATKTTLSCNPDYGDPSTTCKAKVTGESGSISGELVYWSSLPELEFSPAVCVLAGSPASCSVSIAVVGVPFVAAAVTVAALYAGDESNAPSQQLATVEFHATPQAATTTSAVCSPDYGDPTTTCTATVSGESGSISGELVEWSSASPLAFSPTTCVLSGSPASCSVSVTLVAPIAATAATLTATYPGDANNYWSSASPLVEFYGEYYESPTTTVVSCSPVEGEPSTTCTATVTGESGSIGGESVEWAEASGVPGILGFTPATCVLSGTPESCSVSVGPMFAPTSEDVVQAVYPGDPSDAPSVGNLSVEFEVAPPSLEVSPGQSPANGAYSVTGSGFTPSSGATVSFAGLDEVPAACSDGTFSGPAITTDASGDFVCTFSVPSVGPGSYAVVGTDLASGEMSEGNALEVTTLALTVNPTQGPIGLPVTVTGTGFTVLSPVALILDGVTILDCTAGSLTTDSAGDFACTFPVPAGTSGTKVTATDASGQIATERFTVTTPRISVSPNRGPAGAPYQVVGSGFSPNSGVTVSFGGAVQTTLGCSNGLPPEPTITTDGTGDFDCTFVNLEVPAGSYPVVANDLATGTPSPAVKFLVTTPSISLIPSRGPVGASFTVLASGFSLSSLASIVFDGAYQPAQSCLLGTESLGEVTTSTTGAFECTFTVPSVPPGTSNVEVMVQGSFATPTKTFTVVTPTVAASPDRGPAGTVFTVTGTGYSATSGATVGLGGAVLTPDLCTVGTYPGTGAVITTNGASAFKCTFTVPSVSAGAYELLGLDLATGASSAPKTFTVSVPTIVLSPSRGAAGTSFTVSGTGFSVDSAVTVSFDGKLQQPTACSVGTILGSTILTSSTGAFKCTFTVPNAPLGDNPVVAEDLATGTSSAPKTFTEIP